MKQLLFIAFLLFLLPQAGMAQKKNKKCREGCAPKVSIYIIEGDSVKLISHLFKNKENRIKIVLEGGIENVKNTVYVTSKQAVIRQDTTTKDEYIVIPQQENCEIIVDVQTFETYNSVREVIIDGKPTKEIINEYPPKTYMVSYEKYEVK